ncbi:lactaldehyde reductase [Pectobacterium parmentieri]|uniref:Lactaldehyde reductase n=1 Tax=Pectobacterium parmentieri TaxID=1905730 RepID=A0A0H3I2Q2_PECPM|nr:lactaldehyde reductase [Pectobacterium parmentieri]AFI88862.1 Lactaldehyde reductase [Pectobacterium parmentieri]MBI0473294.1 lactaldehyde reductase [Pectobacterium parmentieri]MBI0492389.1 lactaldehyde reductase [Pectobacterium parmentieri]MBI0552720.1 lactaldehyde reductase [Pectobacterium parmentieri]MBI0557343.1 lactaldehyde reductase [Pectobacterium parmentieri]
MANRMILNETSYFGAGAIAQIADEVKRRGFRKALLVTDKDLVKFGVAAKVTAKLDAAGLPYDIYDEVIPNPTISVVEKGIERFKASQADYLIAIGGGSPQDTCKAIGIIINNPEFADVRSLEGVAATRRPAVPIIAIPTTSGTAAEVTINYVITDEEKRRKFVCVDPHDIPIVAIVDPDMMMSMPASLKAATGIDALTHAIEGFTTKAAWELTDTLHLKAIEIISRSLRDSVAGKPKGVEEMALGQYIAGMGFSNVGLGLVHGMAHPLGAFYNTPHGVANAILLPHIMAYNADYTGEKFRDIAIAMGVKDAANMSMTQAREAAINAVRQLSHDVDIPPRLRDVGVREEDIPALAQAAFDDVCTGGNPRDTNIDDIKALYQSIY